MSLYTSFRLKATWCSRPAYCYAVVVETLNSLFPIVDLDAFLAHPMDSKDRRRVLTSGNSEDWVTWTVTRTIQRRNPEAWWSDIVELANRRSVEMDNFLTASDPPVIDLWRPVESPPDYEKASRRRMASSHDAKARDRAGNAKYPVEGRTEVDAVLDGNRYLVFIEAKLLSKVETSTKHDPNRNQIARNIDCVIEHAGEKRPYFWMFVRRRGPGDTGHWEIIDRYRSASSVLAKELPHRDPIELERILRNLAVIEWRELMPLIPAAPELKDALVELYRRVR